jgi:hypothetical protein
LPSGTSRYAGAVAPAPDIEVLDWVPMGTLAAPLPDSKASRVEAEFLERVRVLRTAHSPLTSLQSLTLSAIERRDAGVALVHDEVVLSGMMSQPAKLLGKSRTLHWRADRRPSRPGRHGGSFIHVVVCATSSPRSDAPCTGASAGLCAWLAALVLARQPAR